ncbi:DUF397 domain-containing protein [Streptomyces caeruleatus]|uniref:DUF397 domain-containing protein n=1 Tax=Streptomyces caeruleatus TaxID=661399 RepID=A0A101U1K6_9ACTN|nr:DUF397 domain-containing protein [Streptomyces caeruleatus]KUO02516.1 hypothetical protein AQJ67_22060 [Streptomyces caeruleatus]
MVSSEHTASDSSAFTGWYKSSYSAGNQGECLEVARGHATIPVRDSKSAPGPAVLFSTDGWRSFIGAVKQGRIGA